MSLAEFRVVSIASRVREQYHIAKTIIRDDDFQTVHALAVWKALAKLSDEDSGFGHVAVLMALDESSRDWLQENISCTYAETGIEIHCQTMIEETKKARLLDTLSRALGNDEIDVAKIEGAIDEYRDVRRENSKTFNQALSETVDYLERASEGQTGLLTGINCIDRQTGGLQDGRVLVVAARTGCGKTALSNQIAMNVAARNIPVGICSLEMGVSELTLRAIAYSCKASLSGLFRADDEALKTMSVMMAHNSMATWPVHFNTDDYKLDALVSQITVWASRDKIKLAVVDHIGLVEVSGAKSANERISEVSRTFKKLAKKLGIPIILVSQLNRANDKEKRSPKLSDLRDSGSIEQDADMVILMNKILDDHDQYVRHDLDIAKNRQGPVGRVSELILFDGVTQTFREQER